MKITSDIIKPCYIDHDEHNFTVIEEKVFREGKHVGETYDSTLGHFSSLEGALGYIANKKIRESHETITIENYIKQLKKIHEDIRRLHA